MIKVEHAYQAKEIALDFLAKMGVPIWSSEISSVKKSDIKTWLIEIKTTRRTIIEPEIIKIEIEMETGNVISYEKK